MPSSQHTYGGGGAAVLVSRVFLSCRTKSGNHDLEGPRVEASALWDDGVCGSLFLDTNAAVEGLLINVM